MNNTDPTYREQGRAVFLAAIMVLSMVAIPVALSAPAAALSDDNDIDTSQDVTTAGESTGLEVQLTNISGNYSDLTGNQSSIELLGLNLTDGTGVDLTGLTDSDINVSINGTDVTDLTSTTQYNLVTDDTNSIPSTDNAIVGIEFQNSAGGQVAVDFTNADTVTISIANSGSFTNPTTLQSNVALNATFIPTQGAQVDDATVDNDAYSVTAPNVEAEPQVEVVENGTVVDYAVNVTDSNGNPISGTSVQASAAANVDIESTGTTSATNTTDADGEALFSVVNQSGVGLFSEDITFTEQTTTTGSATSAYVTINNNRGVLTGNIRDLNGNIPDNVENTSITITGTDGTNEIYNETFQSGDSGADDEYTRSVPTQGDDTQYTVSANLTGFDDFSGTPLVSPGQTTTQDIRIERIITPDDIFVSNLDPDNEVDVDRSVNVTLNVTTDDNVGSTGDPLADTPVEAGVNSDNLPVDNVNDIFIDTSALNQTTNTDSNGQVTFTVSVDPAGSATAEDIAEIVDTTIRFEATEGDDVDTTQELRFVGEPQSGSGVIQGEVSQIADDVELGVQNADRASGVGVHAVRFNRLDQNTVAGDNQTTVHGFSTTASNLSVAPGNTDHARTIVWNTTSNEVVRILDVQDEYLTHGFGADVNQNLSIESTGFDAEVEAGAGVNGDYAVSILEDDDALDSQHSYAVEISDNGNFTTANEVVTFGTTNDLTYDGIEERYADVPARPTDETNEYGDYNLQNLFTNTSEGLSYYVIAGNADSNLGYANGQAYDRVINLTSATTGTQVDTPLNVQQIRLQADDVDIENIGMISSPDSADAGYENDLEAFENTTDEFRQTISRDGENVDVIDVSTFVDDGTGVGANVTISWTATSGFFNGKFLNTTVNGEVISHTDSSMTINTDAGSGNSVVFLQSDNEGLGTDSNVTINADLDNAAGTDSTDKLFEGVLSQEYLSGSITGVVTDANDNPVDARIYISEIIDPDAGASVVFERNSTNLEEFTATVYDHPDSNSGDAVETVELTADDMRSFDFSKFDSSLSLGPNETDFELLADRAADRTTLSPVPAVNATSDVSLALTGVSQTGETGTSVSTRVEVDRTSTASIVIEGIEQPQFDVRNLEPTDYTAEYDEVFDVSADVRNIGDLTGEKDVELRLDGDTVATQSVSVDAGATENVVFSVDASNIDAGNYTHSVWTEDDEVSGSLTVEEAPETGLSRFDTNDNGQIDFGEVLAAISANNEGTQIGGVEVTFQDVLDVIAANNDGTPV